MIVVNETNSKEFFKEAEEFIRNPVFVNAILMQEDFKLDTIDGTFEGKAGEYLLQFEDGSISKMTVTQFNNNFVYIGNTNVKSYIKTKDK